MNLAEFTKRNAEGVALIPFDAIESIEKDTVYHDSDHRKNTAVVNIHLKSGRKIAVEQDYKTVLSEYEIESSEGGK